MDVINNSKVNHNKQVVYLPKKIVTYVICLKVLEMSKSIRLSKWTSSTTTRSGTTSRQLNFTIRVWHMFYKYFLWGILFKGHIFKWIPHEKILIKHVPYFSCKVQLPTCSTWPCCCWRRPCACGSNLIDVSH